MTVKELIELNDMITDLEITVRIGGNLLLDQLNIGCAEGIKPRYPLRVPKDRRYANNMARHDDEMFRDAAYIPKSINSWDNGKDCYQILLNRIPAKWLDLTVHSWECTAASRVTHASPRRERTHFYGQYLKITALPSSESLEIKENTSEKSEVGLPGQMNINDFLTTQEDDNGNTDTTKSNQG